MEPDNGQAGLDGSAGDMTITENGLAVRRRRSGNSVHLQLDGELDTYSSHLLERWMLRDEQDGCAELVLDLNGLSFVDSSGLRTLIEAAKRAGAGAWRLSVVNVRGMVRKIFDITDMDSLLDYCQRQVSTRS